MSVGKNKRQPQRSKHCVIFECQCCSGWFIYSGAGPDQQHSKCVFETAVQIWMIALLQYPFCLLVRVFSFDNYTNNLCFWESFVNINLKFSFHTAWWLSYICLYYDTFKDILINLFLGLDLHASPVDYVWLVHEVHGYWGLFLLPCSSI